MDVLSLLEVFLYAVTALLYLGYHLGFRERASAWARVALVVTLCLHFAGIGVRCFRGAHPLASTAEAMSFVAWLITVGFFAANLRHRLDAAGAFAVPSALVLLVLARVVPEADTHSANLTTLGLVHIFLATLGVATFALAAVLSSVYLVQERQLKKKRFGKLPSAGTPLATLDKLGARCVSVGFPVFTLAVVTGAIWVARLGVLAGGGIRVEHVVAVATWLAFGALLVARAGAGWQGRRAAWLTLGGFAGMLLVVAGYFLRHAS